MADSVETLVVGAGQVGIAASAHLTRHGLSRLVIEKDRIAQSWRTAVWPCRGAHLILKMARF